MFKALFNKSETKLILIPFQHERLVNSSISKVGKPNVTGGEEKGLELIRSYMKTITSDHFRGFLVE